jgi:hypothetical protein
MKVIDKAYLGKTPVYLHPEADRDYRRVVGGLAWPFPPRPGFLVVLAEDLRADKQSGLRSLWVIAEKEAEGIMEMHRHCLELSALYQAGPWYGNPANRTLMNLFNRQNREMTEARVKPLVLMAAPYHDDPRSLFYYLQTINSLARSSQKVLYFGESSQLPSCLINLALEEMSGPAERQPAIAALGYALTSLRMREPLAEVPANYLEKNTWSPYPYGH